VTITASNMHIQIMGLDLLVCNAEYTASPKLQPFFEIKLKKEWLVK